MDVDEENCEETDAESVADEVIISENVQDETSVQEADTPAPSDRSYRINRSILWNFYKRIPPYSKGLARCMVCHEVRSHKSSSSNLKSHLKSKHPRAHRQMLELIEKARLDPTCKSYRNATEDAPDTDGSKKSCNVWQHYVRVPPPAAKMARCKYCYELRSYRTTTANLRQHLARKHLDFLGEDREMYLKMTPRCKTYEKRKRGQILDILGMPDNDDVNNTTGNVNLSSEICRHFDVEEDEATCGLCREPVAHTLERMKNHLEENHTSVFDGIAQKLLDAATEGENPIGDDDMYTEVVYLEDEPKLPVHKPKKIKIQQRQKIKVERNSSVSSDEADARPKRNKRYLNDKEEPDELEAFVIYITALLKKVPTDNSQKLHLEIINLIMNATQRPNNVMFSDETNTTVNENNVNLHNGTAVSEIGKSQNDDINTDTQIPTVLPKLMQIKSDSAEPKLLLIPNSATSTISVPKIVVSRNSLSMPEIRVITNTNNNNS